MSQDQSSPPTVGRRQMTEVSLASNLDVRYWMQTLGISRAQLEDAVRATGPRVENVMNYLHIPERRTTPDR
jgi:hypothetical protein